jgi:hypothetical protein
MKKTSVQFAAMTSVLRAMANDDRMLLRVARRALKDHPDLAGGGGYTAEMEKSKSVAQLREAAHIVADFMHDREFNVRQWVSDWLATYRNRPVPASVRVATDYLLSAIEDIEDHEQRLAVQVVPEPRLGLIMNNMHAACLCAICRGYHDPTIGVEIVLLSDDAPYVCHVCGDRFAPALMRLLRAAWYEEPLAHEVDARLPWNAWRTAAPESV